MLPREIGACAWLEQVGSANASPSQAHAPPTEHTTQRTQERNIQNPFFSLLSYRKRNGQLRAARAGLDVLARSCRFTFSVALSHLRYHFSAHDAHIYAFVPTVEIIEQEELFVLLSRSAYNIFFHEVGQKVLV